MRTRRVTCAGHSNGGPHQACHTVVIKRSSTHVRCAYCSEAQKLWLSHLRNVRRRAVGGRAAKVRPLRGTRRSDHVLEPPPLAGEPWGHVMALRMLAGKI